MTDGDMAREDGIRADPGAALDQVGRWQGDVRARGRAWWIPLVVFGAVVALAVPAHVDYSDPAPGSTESGGPDGSIGGVLTLVWRTYLTPNPEVAAVYWTVAMVAGFVVTGVLYRRRSAATGVQGPVGWFVRTGLWATAAMVPLVLVPVPLFRTTTAVAVIAILLIALAVKEKDRALTVFVVLFAAVALLVNTYNTENLLYRLGVPVGRGWGDVPNLVLPALVLLGGGLLAWIRQRSTSPRPR